jgi:DNA modification methylase
MEMDLTKQAQAYAWQRVEALKPYPNNPRKHSKAQVRLIAESIEAFGFTNPILVDEDNVILAGHGRYQAALMLGLDEVPTIRRADLSPAQKTAYVIADNRIAEQSDWDETLLSRELEALAVHGDLDLTLTGFSMPEIDFKLQDLAEVDPDADDEDIPDAPAVPLAKPGDLWLLGPHRILCGDALDPASYGKVMQGGLAQMVITDPPYNVPIEGHVSGRGKTKHGEFAMASGEMTETAFRGFLSTALGHAAAHSVEGSIHYVFMDWRHIDILLAVGKAIYSVLKNICVWAKDNGGLGALYRSRHELVAVFKLGGAPHINNVNLGGNGRYRTNVWNYRGVNTLRKGRAEELAMHPTVKPARMIADAIRDCSHQGGLVLDPFGGSGSTLVAAERTGRVARLIELEPKYVDVAILRWQRMTGQKAVNAATGQPFGDTMKEIGHG